YADLQRSIPSVVDGLKPSQRKVLFGCFKKNLSKSEAKVVQIAGYIAEHTAYHHGESSLHSTIINMAQDYVGANNVPYLQALGQFGTRAQGGRDFASPRYIFTRLSPLARLLFPSEDDGLLDYVQEDGQRVEPRYFVPVVPTLLLNGTHGIGTGWSTYVPPFHLPHVVEAVERRIRGTGELDLEGGLHPYVVGFQGTIEGVGDTGMGADTGTGMGGQAEQYRTTGVIRRLSHTQVEISELPYGVWTEDYKKVLFTLMEGGQIRDFREHHSTDRVRFEVTGVRGQLDLLEKKGLETSFRLVSNINLTNMHAFDAGGKICKYTSAGEVLEAHYGVRGGLYGVRKGAVERRYRAEEMRSRNRARFVSMLGSGELLLTGSGGGGMGGGMGVSEVDIERDLASRGFATEAEIHRTMIGAGAGTGVGGEGVGGVGAGIDTGVGAGVGMGVGMGLGVGVGVGGGQFAYLLDLPILSLSEARCQRLHQAADTAAQGLAAIATRSADDLWLADLHALREACELLQSKK
ncbi:DNA topoisomerase, partial [Ochromonadaceae sp. CCMP2298]